jgi:tRNA(fMet)-specific endonuclease VapC
MVLLDTDHISLLERGGSEGEAIRTRLRAVPLDDVATSIISYEEQGRGWLARIAQAQTIERKVLAYQELKRQLQNYCSLAVLDYDIRAAMEFERLRQVRIRVGTKDLQIAAIALVNNATLLTRNMSDFGKVPGLRMEDWSV